MPIGAFRLNGLSAAMSITLGDFAISKVLDNPNAFGTSTGDLYGMSVAVSDNYAIVSAYFEDATGATSAGKAYIYSTTTEELLYTLNDPNAYGTAASDYFGQVVAICENYAIVGAQNEDDAGGSGSGKAYIYSTTTGSLLYTLNNPNAYSTGLNDNFGSSVAISNSYAIVGAYLEDDSSGTNSGKAYIYSTSTGSLYRTLNNPNPYSTSANDYFGWSVGTAGNYAIVGAPYEDISGSADTGKAYIYSISTGSLLYTLNNPNSYGTGASDYFGMSVAISNSYAIVGAPYEDDATGIESGKAYIYSTSTGTRLYTLNNPNAYSTGASDYFGRSVAICENYAIVGAYNEDEAGGTDSGKAYIFSTTTGSLLYTLNNPNAYTSVVGDNFGNSVGISDKYAIVGAVSEDEAGGNDSGKAYMYSRVISQQI